MDKRKSATADWEETLTLAVKMLDKAKIKRTQWSFGGGTALAVVYKHRESKDIDIFIHDVQLLTLLTPRLNDFTDSLSTEYKEASNFLKLAVKKGEIDFIVAPFLTKAPFKHAVLGPDLSVRMETPAEIIVKKVFYRGDTLTARDIYDIAFTVSRHTADLMKEVEILAGCREAALKRIEALEKRDGFKEEMAALHVRDEELADRALAIVKDFFTALTPDLTCRPAGHSIL